MAYDRHQEAYELSPTSPAVTTGDAAARRPSTASRQLIDETNSDSPISDENAKDKEKDKKDGKEQQPGLGDYFVSLDLD